MPLNDRGECAEMNHPAIESAIDEGHREVIPSGPPLENALLQAERLGLSGQARTVA